MLPMLNKHAMITAALLATLTLSACGKKKDVIAAAPQTPQTEKTEEPKPAPKIPDSEGTDSGNTDGHVGGGLPDSNPNTGADTDYNGEGDNQGEGEGEDTYNQPDTDPGSDSGSSQGSDHSSRPSTRPDVPPPVTDSQPVPVQREETPSGYVYNDANNVTRDEYGKRYTGGIGSDGLLYTSSSTDDILTFLRARNKRVNEESRRNNLASAASVVHAKVSVDGPSGNAIVTLKVQEQGRVVAYNLAGSAQSGPANNLRVVSSGNGERTTGTRELSGSWKCVDLDGGCENIFVRMKIGTGSESGIINVVFRNSKADLWFSLPGKNSGSQEYARLEQLAINTIKKVDSKNRLRSATIRSWEVVNGQSGVTFVMKAYNGELLAFAGPLLAPEKGTKVDIKLARLDKDREESFALIDTSSASLKYQSSITDARILNNNGLGQVRVVLTTKGQDRFSITFMRRLKAIVDLTDANLK